ncbi:MAG: DMT family transporter [Deltaproteobacteria bacterium]|nr:DMT family transporter [Deltaproteobacteria bacterium]
MTRRAWFLFGGLAVIWGLPYLLIKVAVQELSPASVVFLRTTVGAALLVPVALARGRPRALLARWRPLVLFTVLELAVPWLLLSDAERRLSSSLAGLLVASVPWVGALLARLAGGHEPMGGRGLAGLALGLGGLVALLGIDLTGGDLFSVGEMVLVVVGYAVGPMVIARRLSDLPTLDVVAGSLALAALAYAPVGIAQLPSHLPSPAAMGAVLGLGVFCTAIAFLLFFRLIAEVGPVRATVVAYLNPAVAVAAGVALLAEPFTLGMAVGFPLILLGSYLATHRPARAAPAAPGAVASGA